MSSIFERRSFKIILIAVSSALVLGISAGIVGLGWYKKLEHARAIQAKKDAEWEYREKFRLGLSRVRQNLKLDHFLAAYKNLERLSAPPADDQVAKDEYAEVLNRIGRGLLQNQLLKESEDVFQTLREFEGNFETANSAISEIESKRRIESSHFHFAQGQRLYDEKKYHDAFGEYQKADVDLNSVENLKFDDIREEKEKLLSAMREVKFFLYKDTAEKHIRESEKLLKLKDFANVQGEIGKAAAAIGHAAFLRPTSEFLKPLRDKLDALDAELGYQFPNSIPIYNRFTEESVGKVPRVFRITGYEFDPNPDSQNTIRIGLKFVRDNNEPYFIVRYRIYFSNNHDFFNGHFIMPDANTQSAALEGHTVYRQEIPERFKGIPIQRIEVRVFSSDDIIVSSIIRAFRRDS